ncbi:MAG TPA: twin-arginine translocase TatA/TatE family subunit [Bdellovibrionota bacterium]|jgi:sec-independent protein translocase protein TatA|nr:twin-arginine translocase TatA/TatE family subunit [Bdellovibrionota bacterium]
MLGFGELVLITIILLLLFGPSRLAGIGPSLGKAIRGFREGLEGKDEEAKKKLAEKEKDVTPPKDS